MMHLRGTSGRADWTDYQTNKWIKKNVHAYFLTCICVRMYVRACVTLCVTYVRESMFSIRVFGYIHVHLAYNIEHDIHAVINYLHKRNLYSETII